MESEAFLILLICIFFEVSFNLFQLLDPKNPNKTPLDEVRIHQDHSVSTNHQSVSYCMFDYWLCFIPVQIMRHLVWFLFTSKTMKSLRAQTENHLWISKKRNINKSAANSHVYIIHYIGVEVQISLKYQHVIWNTLYFCVIWGEMTL